MKKILVLFLLLVSFTSFGQFVNYTNINGRYKWIAGKFDSTFTLPSGTTPSLRVGGGTGPGALFYSTTDSTVYEYTGSQWRPLHGSDTGRIQIAYVRNTTASPMTTGQVVYINGSTGNVPTIALAVNTADSTSAMTFGFVRGAIPVNGFGWITTFGPINGINTNAYDEGEVIYLDSIPGGFTHFKPQAPYHMVTLGYIIKKAANGIIFTKIQNGYELEELHNVRITSPVRNNAILSYDSVAQLWKDTTLNAIGGVTGTGTSGQVAYWTGTNTQSGSATLTYTPTSQLLINNSVTASSAIARGINATPTLVAAANNDVLVGLDINPTFTNGAFTGVSNLGLRVQGSAGTNLSISNTLNTYGNTSISSQTATAHIFYALPSTNGGEIAFQANNTGQTSTPRIAFYNSSAVRLANIFADNFGMQLGARQPSGSIPSTMYVYSAANRSASQLALTTITGDLSDNNTVVFRGHWTGANALILKAFSSSSTVPTLKVRNVNDNGDVLSVTSLDNVLIGSSTDGGQRLQVTGDALIKGSGNTSGTTALTVQNSSGTNSFTVRNDGIVFFQTLVPLSSPSTLEIYGGNQAITGIRLRHTATSTHTSGERINISITDNFAPTSGTGTQSTLALEPTINQTGGSSGASRGILIRPTLTAAADWRSIEWSNNSGWGLYGAGTANNYLAGSLGIGTISLNNSNLRIAKTITGAASVNSIISESPITSGVTSQANVFVSTTTTQNASFTLSNIRHFWAAPDAKGASSTITNEFGFVAGSSLTNATNNYGFYGDIPSGTGRWNIYMSGTAANYINGNLLLGSTVDGGQKLQVTGNAIVNGTLSVENSSFTGQALTISKIANATHRINGGPSENITFGPSNRIFLNTSEVSVSTTLAVGTSIVCGIASSTGLLINNGQTNQQNTTRTGITLQTQSWRNDGAGSASTVNAVQISPTADMTLGTTTGTVLLLNPTINTTGGTSTLRGLYYNPTLTSLTGATHRAIETVSGDVLLGTTSGNLGIGTSTLGTATKLTLGGSQTASSAIARGGLINTTLTAAANNDALIGLDISPTYTNGAFTGVTNTALRTVTGNVLFATTSGSVGIGTSSPQYKLDVNGTFRTQGDTYLVDGTGSVGVNTTSIHASAIFEIKSTTKGFRPPVMTGAQAEAISSPAEGLMIYADPGNGLTITSKGWWGYDGSNWVKLN